MEHSDTCFQNIIITASFNLEFTAVVNTLYTLVLMKTESNVTQHTYLQLIQHPGSLHKNCKIVEA